ncbi:MAG: DUF6036 family nucleotidyltransferase [Victivallales bacterium]|jgi:hypothetical protein
MSNSLRLLKRLDELLDSPVELTLYGRAALELGFINPKPEYSRSLDVDIVLWIGQAEELDGTGNFWEALEHLNKEFDADGLYISHLFEESQVILSSQWRKRRIAIPLSFSRLKLFRLSDMDLFLSKLMRYDPTDLEDILFIIESAKLSPGDISLELNNAQIPDLPEIREQFDLCRNWLKARALCN